MITQSRRAPKPAARKRHATLRGDNIRLTDKEKLEICGMRHSFGSTDIHRAVGEFTQGIADLLDSGDPTNLYRALSGMEQVKSAFQRMHNYNHTVGMLAAKAFLEQEFPELPWEEISFAENANKPGADIFLRAPTARIIAELKTTEPCGRTPRGITPTKFGSNQKKEVEKDLRRLADPKYKDFAKYMFVTSGLAYRCLMDYRKTFPTICFVLLSGNPEVSRPLAAMPPT